MQDVLKIVRERLQAATPVVNHPDADVLTAFAEKSLPTLERDVVLEHLARCGDCRDVLALALPATEDVAASTVPARSGWLTWPALRWGFVTAGVVAIAAVGILQYQRRLSPTTVALKQATQDQVARNEAPAQPPVPSSSVAAAGKRDEARTSGPGLVDNYSADGQPPALTEPRHMARADSPARIHAPQVNSGAFGGLAGGPALYNNAAGQLQNNQSQVQNFKSSSPPAVAVQPTPAPPPASPTVEVSSQALEINTESAVRSNPPAAQPPHDYLASAKVDKAKPAANVAGDAAAPAPTETTDQQELPKAQKSSLTGRSFAKLATLTAPMPRWTISSTGVLQRSYDQGNNWQDVDVNAALSANLDVEANVLRGQERGREKDSDKKFERQAYASPTFRAVAATGADVWAGGSNAALYHSLDAGNHWTRIVPSSGGATLTGDIIALEFSDAQHGKVKTSASEVWTTTDDGQSWQKQ